MTTLPSARELRERVDTAQVLTRFHHLERALTVACGGWIPAVPRLEQKAALARAAWQCALAADALRDRVFELRYPSRLLEAGADAPLIGVYEAAIDAPDADAFLRGLSDVLCPALLAEYRDFLQATDELDDGPTARILEAAARDKDEHIASLGHGLGSDPGREAARPRQRTGGGGLGEPGGSLSSGQWVEELRRGLETLERPTGRPFQLAEDPARDDRYFASSVYWPDVVDPTYPYGEGLALQVRSAVSHVNEVWAVETAGAILEAFAEPLGWEFVRDAARWTYDESRHMLMGQRRLEAWGIEPGLVPLGGYIYSACKGQDPVYRLGMLGYFETKNIGRKRERAEAFRSMGDRMSETDMEFDWADETLHAEYGRRWLKRLLEVRGADPEGWPEILERCEELVQERVARTTEEEKQRIRACADRLLQEAARRAIS